MRRGGTPAGGKCPNSPRGIPPPPQRGGLGGAGGGAPGDLRPGADPASLASDFERAGAAAVSILVDERFDGSFEDLRAARSATRIPLLAKGFFSRPRQLEE